MPGPQHGSFQTCPLPPKKWFTSSTFTSWRGLFVFQRIGNRKLSVFHRLEMTKLKNLHYLNSILLVLTCYARKLTDAFFKKSWLHLLSSWRRISIQGVSFSWSRSFLVHGPIDYRRFLYRIFPSLLARSIMYIYRQNMIKFRRKILN